MKTSWTNAVFRCRLNKRPGGNPACSGVILLKTVPVRAECGGVWKVVGTLLPGNPPIFVQRIRPGDVLRIRGAAGVDLHYDPPLPPECVIRHEVGGTVYEIGLDELLKHPATCIGQVGSLHPRRAYLAYAYWRNVTLELRQPALFQEAPV